MATTGMLPTSNVAGNNQTSPGLGSLNARPMTALPGAPLPVMGSQAPTNPYLSTPTTGAVMPGAPTGSLYNTASSQPGQTDINKQLLDILGKGVGGSLDNILKGMSGTDSAIFQQWLAGQRPVQAQEQAQLETTFGAQGLSPNSTVSALGESNLQAQFNAQAAQVNQGLMSQQLQDTLGVLQGLEGPAIKEVATSPWTILADVANQVTGDVGALFGGPGPSPSSNPANSIASPNLSPGSFNIGNNLPTAAPGGYIGPNDMPGLGSGTDSYIGLFA